MNDQNRTVGAAHHCVTSRCGGQCPPCGHKVLPLVVCLVLAAAASTAMAEDVVEGPVVSEASPRTSDVADAAQAKDWARVENLCLTEPATIDGPQPDGMTALHWAVYHGHIAAVDSLLKAKADPNAATDYRVTPLQIACEAGHAKIVVRLVKMGADVNVELPGGVTPLMYAARAGSVEAIRILTAHQASVEAAEDRGQTALMWASSRGNRDAVTALIEAGANVAATSRQGFTAVMFAARDGHPDVVQELYRAGADVNTEMTPRWKSNRAPRKGTSALTLAVESGHFELAMLLVRCGADPNDQRSGFTPLHAISWVRKPGRGENSDGDPPPRGSGSLTSLQFVRELVAAGADVNARLMKGKSGRATLSHEGATPFLFAGKTADVPLMKLLVELGADPLLTNVDGCNALMAAAGVGVKAVGEEAGTEHEVVKAIDLLAKLGLDVNTVDRNGETAMHGAGYRNFPDVVDCLARLGARSETWNHKNEWGWTPVMIAQGHRPGSFKPSPVTVAAMKRAMKPPGD